MDWEDWMTWLITLLFFCICFPSPLRACGCSMSTCLQLWTVQRLSGRTPLSHLMTIRDSLTSWLRYKFKFLFLSYLAVWLSDCLTVRPSVRPFIHVHCVFEQCACKLQMCSDSYIVFSVANIKKADHGIVCIPNGCNWQVYFKGVNERFPEGGKMTQYMNNMKIGDTIHCRGPTGKERFKPCTVLSPIQAAKYCHFSRPLSRLFLVVPLHVRHFFL